MKGIAITLMVMGHIMIFSFQIDNSQPARLLTFNMPLFFYISGFLAYKPITKFKDLLDKIIHRSLLLLVPYIVFLTLYYIYDGKINLIIHLLMNGGQKYWFLYDLFILSSFFMLYEYVTRRINKPLFSVVLWIVPLFILIAIKLYVSRTFGTDYDGYGLITGLTNYYRYYLIGYLCRKYEKINSILFNNSITFAIGFICYFLNWYFFNLHNILLIFFGALGAIIVIQNLVQYYVQEDSKLGLLLMNVGRCSLGIYVIHYFLIPQLPTSFQNFLVVGNPFIWQFTFAILTAFPIIVVSCLIFKTISMNHWLNLMFFGKLSKK